MQAGGYGPALDASVFWHSKIWLALRQKGKGAEPVAPSLNPRLTLVCSHCDIPVIPGRSRGVVGDLTALSLYSYIEVKFKHLNRVKDSPRIQAVYGL